MQFTKTIQMFSEVLTLPEGFQIDWVEFTTWSLAKDFLRLIPAMILHANSGMRTSLTKPNLVIKTHNGKRLPFHIFYDGKNQREYEEPTYYQTPDGKYAQYILYNYCTPVKLKEGLFHPKIILVQFKNGDGEYQFRVLISSKNLTWTNYFEAGVILESDIISEDATQAEQDERQAGKALSKFFKKYYKEFDHCNLKFDLLKQAVFKVKKGTTNGEFFDPKIWFGKEDCLKSKISAAMGSRIMRICSMNPQEGVFGVSDGIQYICNFKDIYEQDPSGSNSWKYSKKPSEPSKKQFWYIGKGESEKESKKNPAHLHIKSYTLWDKSWKESDKTTLTTFIGSANCSKNGLQKINEEVLVQFDTEISKDFYLYFPCKVPGTRTEFCEENGKKIYFHNLDTVTNPNVPEDVEDEEKPIRFNVTVNEAKYDKGTITVKITNDEKTKIWVWLATLSDTQELTAKEQEFEFKVNESTFTDLLLMSDGKITMSIRLDLKSDDGPTQWQGKDYDRLKEDLPIESIAKISELLEDIPGITNKDDAPFEKLLKCKMHRPDEFKGYIESAKNTIKHYENLFNPQNTNPDDQNNDSDDQNTTRTLALFEKYHKEIEDLKKMLEYLERGGGQ